MGTERYVIYANADKCRGCRKCELACIASHNCMTIKEAVKARKELEPRVHVVRTDTIKMPVQCLKAYLFLLSCEGVLLFPVVMLLSYFDLSLQVAVIYTIIVLVLVKILSFYKSYLIFFKRNGLFLQIILYFCALEVVPLSALWGGLVLISHYLKINF